MATDAMHATRLFKANDKLNERRNRIETAHGENLAHSFERSDHGASCADRVQI